METRLEIGFGGGRAPDAQGARKPQRARISWFRTPSSIPWPRMLRSAGACRPSQYSAREERPSPRLAASTPVLNRSRHALSRSLAQEESTGSGALFPGSISSERFAARAQARRPFRTLPPTLDSYLSNGRLRIFGRAPRFRNDGERAARHWARARSGGPAPASDGQGHSRRPAPRYLEFRARPLRHPRRL